MPKKDLKYFLIHKPYKILSQFSSEDGNPGLGTLFQLPRDVYPVGRLDMDSEGLLLLTNDKTINNRLLNPKFGHKRVYRVEVEGVPTHEALDMLRNGVDIKIKGMAYKTKPCKAKLVNDFDFYPIHSFMTEFRI